MDYQYCHNTMVGLIQSGYTFVAQETIVTQETIVAQKTICIRQQWREKDFAGKNSTVNKHTKLISSFTVNITLN